MQVLLLRGGDDSPLLLLPLAVRRQHGVTIASIVGGKQANFHLPLMAPGLSSRLAASRLQELLVAAGRDSLGVDCFVLRNQPLSWRGEANPLAAFGGSASVDVGYRLALGSDAEGMLTRSFSGETRKKMRKKRRSLGEVGTVRFWRGAKPGGGRDGPVGLSRSEAAPVPGARHRQPVPWGHADLPARGQRCGSRERPTGDRALRLVGRRPHRRHLRRRRRQLAPVRHVQLLRRQPRRRPLQSGRAASGRSHPPSMRDRPDDVRPRRRRGALQDVALR